MFLQTMKTKIFALNRLTRLSGYVTGTVIYSSSTLGLKLFAKKGTGTWCMDCQSLEHMVHSAKDQLQNIFYDIVFDTTIALHI